jgi:hypothetical protein
LNHYFYFSNSKYFLIFLESNGGDTESSLSSSNGGKLPRTKSVRFSDGYAPGKVNQNLHENGGAKISGMYINQMLIR